MEPISTIHKDIAIVASEILHQDLPEYTNVIVRWFKSISALRGQLNAFELSDQEIIYSSFRVLNIMMDKIDDECEDDYRFFAVHGNITKKVYAFAIAILSPNEGELMYVATDPFHLPLKDRLDKRVRGAGTAIVTTIANNTNQLFVKPNNSALSFYQKLGFVDIEGTPRRMVLYRNKA